MTAGRLALRFLPTAQEGGTRLLVEAQEPPLRVVRAFPLPDGAALVHLHNLSGGVLGGDQLALNVELAPQTCVQLTTTGATRVYRRRLEAGEAVQTTRLCVAAGALLEYLPDLVIPYAGACYRQSTLIELQPGAGLFYWEVIAPGRTARGECFAYEQVRFDLDIVSEQHPLLVERIRLQPAAQNLAAVARLGPFRYFGSLYVAQVGASQERWTVLETELAAVAERHSIPGEILWGVSTLREHGLVVRAASLTSAPMMSGLLSFWRAAKWYLYRREAIPPRKVY